MPFNVDFPTSCACGNCKGQYITKEGVRNLCKALEKALENLESGPALREEKVLEKVVYKIIAALEEFDEYVTCSGLLNEMTAEDYHKFKIMFFTLASNYLSRSLIIKFLEFCQGDEGLKIYHVFGPTSGDENDDPEDHEDHEAYDDRKCLGDDAFRVVNS